MTKPVIIHASFGHGHKKAASALADFFGVEAQDLLDFSHPIIKKIYSVSYMAITQHMPWLWKMLFSLAKVNFFSWWIAKLHRMLFASFIKYLKDVRPKVVITTHFFPSTLLAGLKKELNIKIIAVVTDLRAYPLWVNECVDYYLTALNTAKNDLIKLGIDEKDIISGYVPLREGFVKQKNRQDLYKKFNLAERPTVLFVSSTRGRFAYLKKVIKKLIKDFNVVIIYGKNIKLKKYLNDLSSPHIKLFSFYEEIWDLISLSSVIIAKPGGLTIFEGLYKKKPFIFSQYIPGQEKENMDILIKYGVAKYVKSDKELLEAIYYFNKNASGLENDYPLKVADIRKVLIELTK